MPYVIFVSDALGERRCDYLPEESLTVLELIRRAGLPIEWRCGLGTCGCCAARVSVLEGAPPPRGNKERNVLEREGHAAGPLTGDGDWRTLCGYRLSGESLRVEQ
jgi:ferredoxin